MAIFGALGTARSGLVATGAALSVIGNNIANVNTVAYKNARATAADAFSNTLQSVMGAPVQVGSGVTTSEVSSIFTQGSMNYTGAPTHLGVEGNGFFMVRDPDSGAFYATRDGSFDFDSAGYLITNEGLRVQGFSDGTLGTRGDIKIDTTGAPAGTPAGAKIRSYRFAGDGKLEVTLDSDATFTRGQVLLQNFVSPQSLVKLGNNLYGNMEGAGALAQTAAPESGGLGTVKAGYLEMSNVDLAGEFSSLITAQRAFQANSRIVTTSDEVLQEVINLKR